MLAFMGMVGLAGCDHESTSSAPASKASPVTPEPNVANAINLPGVFVAKGMRLELLANGRYRMCVHAESANADLNSEGHWSLFGGDLQLDPDDSSEPQRTYMTWSKDAFESNDGSYTLVRLSPLVGTFSGEFPVHPGGFVEEILVLNPDGTFLLTVFDPMIKSDKAADVFNGLWTSELAGARVHLHLNTGEDMLFAVASKDTLIPLDSDGNSVDSKSIGLRRKKSWG